MNKKCSTMFLCCAIALGAQAAESAESILEGYQEDD